LKTSSIGAVHSCIRIRDEIVANTKPALQFRYIPGLNKNWDQFQVATKIKIKVPYPLVAETMMMMMITPTTTPIMIIILMFCHQYFLFSLVAWCNGRGILNNAY
jgi:hypothetical protein